VLARYALLSVAWSGVAAVFTVGLSFRYEAVLATLVPTPIAWTLLAALWAALFLPLVAMVGPPLLDRRRKAL
jgi:hypothetical protein